MKGASFHCPVCGEEVPRNAKSCPECGACEKSGWGDDQYLDGLDLPDEDYTTGEALEPGSRRSGKPAGMSKFWVVVAAIVLVAIVWLTLKSAW